MASYFGRRVLRVKSISQDVAKILESEIASFLPLEKVSIIGDEVCIYVPNQLKNSVKQKMLSILNNIGPDMRKFDDGDIEMHSTIVLVTNIPTQINDTHMDSLMRGFGRTLTKFQFIMWEQLPYSKYGWIVFEDIRSAELCVNTIPSTLINSSYLSCCLLPENVTAETTLKQVSTVQLEGLPPGFCTRETIRDILSITCQPISTLPKFIATKVLRDKVGNERHIGLIDWEKTEYTLTCFRKLDNFILHKDADSKISLKASLVLPGISALGDLCSNISNQQNTEMVNAHHINRSSTPPPPPPHPRSPPPSYESIIHEPAQNMAATPHSMNMNMIKTSTIQQLQQQQQQHQQQRQQQQHQQRIQQQKQHQQRLQQQQQPGLLRTPAPATFPLFPVQQQQQQPIYPLLRPPVNVIMQTTTNNGALALAQLANLAVASQPVITRVPTQNQHQTSNHRNNNNSSNINSNRQRKIEASNRTSTTIAPERSSMRERDRRHNIKRDERKQQAASSSSPSPNKQKTASVSTATPSDSSDHVTDELMTEAQRIIDSEDSEKTNEALKQENQVGSSPNIDAPRNKSDENEERVGPVPPPPGFQTLPTENNWSTKKNSKRWSASKKTPTTNMESTSPGITKHISEEKLEKNRSCTTQDTEINNVEVREEKLDQINKNDDSMIVNNKNSNENNKQSCWSKEEKTEQENIKRNVDVSDDKDKTTNEDAYLPAWLSAMDLDNENDIIITSEKNNINIHKSLHEALRITKDKSLFLGMMRKDNNKLTEEVSNVNNNHYSLATRKMFAKLF